MKKIKRCLTAAILAGVMFLQTVSVQAQEASTKLPSGIQADELGEKIEEFVSVHEDTTAGMMVSVFDQNETICQDYVGYADKEAGIQVDQDTVMEWGSATKLLVWISVMQLWEQNQIDLDRDIRDYLPEGFLTKLRYDTTVTMKNLMNHNAGFQEVYADLFVKDKDALLTLPDSLKAHEPEQIYEPGTVTAYSNWGVALAAYIVQKVSGERFDDYVHNHIFNPLGMEHSALFMDLSDNTWVQEKRKELQCYTTDGTLIEDCFYYITLYPAGMCTSTLGDFEIFGKALLDKESPLFQKSSTWETLFTPTSYLGDSEVPSNYHGLWVSAYGVETVGHGGNTAGCSSYLLLDRKNGIGAVVMTNQSGETVYNSEMMELVFGKFSEEDYLGEKRSTPKGIYRPARTVRSGPFKLFSLSFLIDEAEPDEFWMTGSSQGVEKISYPYVDFVRVPVWQFVLEMGLFILWIAAALFSLVSLLVKLIRKIVWICKKKKNVIPLGRWSTVAALLQILVLVLLGCAVVKVSSYALFSTYRWMLVVLGILELVIAVLVGVGLRMVLTTKSTKKRKVYNWSTIILLVVTALNILYWNLYQFWNV